MSDHHHSKTKYIIHQLKAHAPFTFIGAILGVGFMFIFRALLTNDVSEKMFLVFHPAHVILSAIATAAMLIKHNKKINIIALFVLGYIGAVGVATLSDTVIPFASQKILGIRIDAHAHAHAEDEPADIHEEDKHIEDAAGHESEVKPDNDIVSAHEQEDADHPATGETEVDDHANCSHDPVDAGHEGHLRLPFIEEWHIITPSALLGVLIAMFWTNTKFPHFGHVLLSIWASLSCVLADMGGTLGIGQWIGLTFALFLAVWIPCCISDIVFPLLFVKPGEPLPEHKH
ncbi:MAG: hypothetical protein JEZ07_01585 [Phycisphaerae bacterium]|nr:hypothetical protein [Phycisphaerae bacterium]